MQQKQLYPLIRKYVKESLGNDYDIKVYGSRATNLCLPSSDIDIVVCCKKNPKNYPLDILSTYITENSNFTYIN